MPLFRFEARDGGGTNISGELEAASEREAARQLHSQGYFVVRLLRKKGSAAALPSGLWRGVLEPVLRPVGSKALAVFFSSFASMLASGMSMHEAAANLAERAPGRTLRRAAREMAEAALRGQPITTIAPHYPAAFPPFVIAILEAGGASGMLEGAMKRLADYFSRAHELELQFRFETFYPKLLIIALILIPTLPTLVMQGIHAWLREVLTRSLPWVIAIVAAWYGWRLLMRVKLLRLGVDRVKLSIPMIGSIVRRNAVSKWCRAMAMLYGAGVPLRTAVETAGSASGNAALAARTQALAYKVMEGQPVSAIMAESGDFPDMAINMMITGERSGSVEASLEKVAEFCEAESLTAGKQTAVLVGVLFYLAVAAAFAFFVLSFWMGYYGGLLQMAEP